MFIKNFLFLFFGFLLGLSSLFAFPNLDYQTQNYPTGEVDIELSASYFTRVELLVNDNFVSGFDLVTGVKEVYINDDVYDFDVNVGQNIEIINNKSTQLNLEIDSNPVSLAPLDKTSISYNDVGDITIRNVDSGLSRFIYVDNSMGPIVFENIEQNFLLDGANNLKFIQKPISGNTFDPIEREFVFNYQKFSNIITIQNWLELTNSRDYNIRGTVSNPNEKLYYIVNPPETIANFGVLTEIELEGNSFDINVSLVREGVNEIKILSVLEDNPNIFTGTYSNEVVLDTIIPNLEILSLNYRARDGEYQTDPNEFFSGLAINGQVLNFELSTNKGITLNYSLNNVNNSINFNENGLLNLTLNLQNQQINNITFLVSDLAGNKYFESFMVEVDNTLPDIIWEEIKPEGIFSGETATFQFQKIEGKTTKPDVKVSVFTLDDRRTTTGSQGEREIVSCSDFEEYFVRNLRAGRVFFREDSPRFDTDDIQINFLSSMFQRDDTTSNSQGNFDVIIALREDTLTPNQDNRVNRVSTTNTICFALEDKFGNINIAQRAVRFDPGNTMWRAGELTTIPNTVRPAEIEMLGDRRIGSGRAQFSVTARFQYVGPGRVTDVRGAVVSQSRALGNADVNLNVLQSELMAIFDNENQELIVYFPVEINPLGIPAVDYPSELELNFQLQGLNYVTDNLDIPIDIVNPIYFQTILNVDSPLDHTKWLSPETIDKSIEFLNRTIDFTRKATEIMQLASIGGVIACTGAKFYYGTQMGLDPENRDEYLEKLFMICDRSICSKAPDRCLQEDGINRNFEIPSDQTRFSGPEISDNPNAQFIREGNTPDDPRILARINTLDISRRTPCITPDGSPGVMASIGHQLYEEERVTSFGWRADATQERFIPNTCIKANFGEEKTADDIFQKDGEGNFLRDQFGNPMFDTGYGFDDLQSLDLSHVTGICYSPGTPRFDNTRCNFFGLDGDEGVANKDPKANLINSIRCGCITDTYSHLKNLLKIQESIRGCLEQAKIGEVRGSYCERLMAQAVCDIATNVLFNSINVDPAVTEIERGDFGALGEALAGAREGDRILNERYRGSFYTQAGLSSQNIVNKVCIGAISGDWSILSDTVLGAIEQNEVEPTFGPAFPESRIQGYNPFTGDLTIQYTFTYAGVSGGQLVRSTATFICDKSKPNSEHCPEGIISSGDPLSGSSFRTPLLQIPQDGSVQDTIIVTDQSARFRYNVLRIEHVYTIEGNQRTEILEETISHKGEFLLANCYFTGGVLGSGAGFRCDTLFTEEFLVSAYDIREQSSLLPSNQAGRGSSAFYSGNSLFFNLFYDIGTQSPVNSADFVYQITCPSNNQPVYLIDFQNLKGLSSAGYESLKILDLPSVEQSRPSEVTLLSGSNLNLGVEGEKKITFSSISGVEGISFSISQIRVNGGPLRGEDGTWRKGVNIPQSLTVNNGGEPSSDSINLGNVPITSIEIELDNKYENLNANIGGTNLQRTSINVNDELLNLQDGAVCTFIARLLPEGQGTSAISSRDLKNFVPFGDRFEGVGSTANRLNQFYETTFRVLRTPRDTQQNTLFFDIIRPVENEAVCLTANGLSLSYVANSVRNTNTGAKVNLTLTFPRYVGSTSKNIDSVKLKSIKDITLDNNDEIERILSSANNDGISLIDAVLTYTVSIEEKYDGEDLTPPRRLAPVQIPIKIDPSCSTSEQSTPTPPTEAEEEEEEISQGELGP